MNSNLMGQQVGVTTFNVGLSAIIQAGGYSGQTELQFQVASGGSLFVAGASNVTVGSGNLVGTTLIFQNYRGPLFFSSVGATTVVRHLYITNIQIGQ